MYIGRETINLEKSFFDLPFVKSTLKGATESCIESLNPIYINEVHGDHVCSLPEGAILHGSSDRTPVEVWTLEDRVFAMQAHPELTS